MGTGLLSLKEQLKNIRFLLDKYQFEISQRVHNMIGIHVYVLIDSGKGYVTPTLVRVM